MDSVSLHVNAPRPRICNSLDSCVSSMRVADAATGVASRLRIRGVVRTVLTAAAAGALVSLAAMAPDTTSPASAPPTSESIEDDESERSEAPAEADGPAPAVERDPQGERQLAEFAFGLFLSSELEVRSGSFSCTEPPSLDVGESVTCFALIDDERVIVAVTGLPEIEGAYEFDIFSDHAIRAADSTTTAATATTSSTTTSVDTSTTALPQPILVTTAPLSQADRDVLAYAEQQINQSSQTFIDNVIASSGGMVTAVSEYSWDPVTATVTFDITLSQDFASSIDTAAWITVRDRSMELWHRDSPFRLPGATIKPSLIILVSGYRYVSDFDLCVQVADQTISGDDWLAAARAT
jgi:hypothetical protein